MSKSSESLELDIASRRSRTSISQFTVGRVAVGALRLGFVAGALADAYSAVHGGTSILDGAFLAPGVPHVVHAVRRRVNIIRHGNPDVSPIVKGRITKLGRQAYEGWLAHRNEPLSSYAGDEAYMQPGVVESEAIIAASLSDQALRTEPFSDLTQERWLVTADGDFSGITDHNKQVISSLVPELIAG